MNAIKNQNGYTLIEVIVSLIILLIVVIPLTQVIGYIFSDTKNIDKINAIYLAEAEMERCVVTKEYYDKETEIAINNREYLVSRDIEENNGLIRITVEVRNKSKNKRLVKFETLRLAGNHAP